MFSFIKKAFATPRVASDQAVDSAASKSSPVRKVLNVGGNNKAIRIPEQYSGWKHVLLDIDPAGGPDVVCDARNLSALPGSEYDSVYCSHNLEHYFHHDVAKVLTGFHHVLKDEGFVYIRVPDMGEVMHTVVRDGLDIEDILYESPAGPIAVIDVIYGFGVEIESSGNDFYAHKTGFTRKSLAAALAKAGFPLVFTRVGNLEVAGIAFKKQPNAADITRLNLPGGFTVETDPRSSTKTDSTIESANLKSRGNEFLSKGKLEEAADCYRQAISLSPRYAEALLNLGFVLREQKLYDEAEGFLRQAIQTNPGLADAFYILGIIAEEGGRAREAIENYSKAIEANPRLELAYRDLCRVLARGGQFDAARKTILKGIALNPDNADFHYYLGNVYLHEKHHEQAIVCFEKALLLRPDYAEVHSNMGKALLELGRYGDSILQYRKALSLDSDALAVEASSCLLFAQSYRLDASQDEYLADAKKYGDMVLANAKPFQHWPAAIDGNAVQPLRIGMVSGDFLSHPVGFFLESVLTHLNPARLELIAYSTVSEEDDLTARIKPRFSAWRSIGGLSDEAAARRIHEDGVHILIDLSGHTSHNRLPIFAWKPAPVQVSWLGYFASTGVPGIDFLLADKYSVPEAERKYFTETIWYLPDSRLCFTPPEMGNGHNTASPPALRNGYPTFGCFQNLSKFNDEVLDAWARIFQGLPNARLRFQCKQMENATAREDLLHRLNRVGISTDRVTLVASLPREEYLSSHAEVDIILDTFPYPGGTTTCEALWMGVPTLTLVGNSMLARQGASMLTCVGMDDWIARDVDEYVALALKWAVDLPRLADTRFWLREKALASPLFDAQRFAANLEDALHGMWKNRSKKLAYRVD